MDCQTPILAWVFPQRVSGMINGQMKGENRIKIKNFKEKYLGNTGGEMEGLTSSDALEASVVSTKISSF